MVAEINAAKLREWMEQGIVTLIDVREQSEWDAGHINGATLMPLSTLAVEALPRIADKKLVIQCRSGKRSHTVCERVLQQWPGQEIYNLEGGILAWEALNSKPMSA